MADISQSPGILNIGYMVRGDPYSFQTLFDGDITVDTFTASIKNNGTSWALAISKSYNSTTLKTTLTFTLTEAISDTLELGVFRWSLIQISNGVPRTVLAGTWGVFEA